MFDNTILHRTNEPWILITGGLGFIGSHTTLEVLKAGQNVVIVDDLSNSFPDVFQRIMSVAEAHFAKIGGICPKAVVHHVSYQHTPSMRLLLETYRSMDFIHGKQRSNITGVIHFASFKAVEESIRQPLRYYRHNLNGLVDFLDLLEEYNVKNFVFSSSAAVYGNLADKSDFLREEQVSHEEELIREGIDSTNTRFHLGSTGITNPYGRTKYFGEAILSDLARSDPGWNIICLRYFNPVGCDASGMLGEDPKGVPSNLLPVVVKVLTGEWKELQVFGNDWDTPDGSPIRDFIHVSDLARGHIAALDAAQHGDFAGGFRTINLGTGSGHSVLEVVAAMEAASGRKVPIKISRRRAGDVGSSVAATDRAARELGWKPTETLLDACTDLWNYLQIREA